MAALEPDTLSLSDQLDALLFGWLERHATPVEPDDTASAIVTVSAARIAEVEAFCERWALRVTRLGGGEQWGAIRIDGPRLPVLGFVQITALFRR
jgi:hypothetical protein